MTTQPTAKPQCKHLWVSETFNDGSVQVKCTLCTTAVTIGGPFIKIFHKDGSLKVDTVDIRTFGL